MTTEGILGGISRASWTRATKTLLLLVLLLVTVALVAQNVKPCIAFSPESTSPTNSFAREPLEAAVMLSGDFDFYASRHDGCWNVHVLSLPLISAKSKPMGYAVSHTVTNPQSIEVGHALAFGPDRDIFMDAMRKAAADAIRNIRLTRSAPKQELQ